LVEAVVWVRDLAELVAHPHHFLLGYMHEYRGVWARWQRPCDPRAAEQRDELASLQLIEVHSVPASQGRITDHLVCAQHQSRLE
jgi:hypothetical protein